MAAPRTFAERGLRTFGEAVLHGYGTPASAAALVVDTLVEADRRGVGTHGLVRLPSYCRQIEQGEVDATAVPRVEADDGPTARVDGCVAFGALTGVLAMDEAIARAERFGVGVVAARRCLHFGTAAYYALRAAERGLIGIAATNTPAVMAPWGGARARVGNNPFAIAAPLPDGRAPFVLDMAQSHVSRGRIKLAEFEGERIPEGWAIGPDGNATTDPSQALAGALLPFGGYKGYGLAVAVEVLTGVLAGGGLSPELANTSMTGAPKGREDAAIGTVGNLYVAIDPARFVGREEFRAALGRYAHAVKDVPTAPGFDEVLLPGELEARAARASDAEGIHLNETTVSSLEEVGRARGVPFPR